MSALSGICYWDKRPVPRTAVGRLAQFSRPLGPDGGGTLCPTSGVVLQVNVLRFDALSATEHQPYVHPQGSVLTWDGRLDNRTDLLLSLHGELPQLPSDAAIVAAALARWGNEALDRLIGDWALVWWDATTQTVLLARDHFGNRPLYYIASSEKLVWATALDALVEESTSSWDVDEAYVAGFLAHRESARQTPYRGVRLLPAGHWLRATQDSVIDVRRWADFTPTTIRYADSRDYASHLRDLLTEAVRVRLRADRTVWAHLSGGFDSSSVVCLAHRLIKHGVVEAPALRPLSMVFPDSPESDESAFVDAVERWCGLTTVRHVGSDRDVFLRMWQERRTVPTVGLLDMHGLNTHVFEAGDRILISGALGDLIMGKSGISRLALLETLHQGDWRQFLYQCIQRARDKQRSLGRVLTELLIAGYLPEAWQRALATRQALRDTPTRGELPQDRLARRLTPDLLAQLPRHAEPDVAAFPLLKRPFVKALYQVADHSPLMTTSLRPTVRVTSPYTHRPLVKFVLGAPYQAFWDPVVSRAGMKRALTDVLPPILLRRQTKGVAEAAFVRAARQLGHLIDDLNLCAPGTPQWQIVTRRYVTSEGLTAAWREAKTGSLEAGAFLQRCFSLEAWLRTHSDRGVCRAETSSADLAPAALASSITAHT